MTTIRNKRQIINRRALIAHIDALLERGNRTPQQVRGDLLALFKDALAAGREEVRHRFEAGATGAHVVRENCYLIDQLVRTLFEFATGQVYPLANPTVADRLALVAIGGYGRGELAPHSDIDLLFLLPYKQTPRGEQVAEYILYMLWDLGVKVGHAVRSVDESIARAKGDITIRTSLLETRYICGRDELFLELRQRFADEIMADSGPDFVEAKLTERDERHQRLGDSRYLVEPNVKEGKGGLRDLHTLFWIAKYLYRVHSLSDLVERKVFTVSEYRRFAKAQNFLWTVRCHLHYLTGRAEERLTFDLQQEIAGRMNYTDRPGVSGVERFMKHYYLVAKDVGDLTRIFCAALEAANQRRPRLQQWGAALFKREVDGFQVEGGRLTVKSRRELGEDPVKMILLFRTAQRRRLDVHPRVLRWITQNLKYIDDQLRADPEANRLFLEILTAKRDAGKALRKMNEAGVLGRFIPDFGRVVAQMQHDMYHVYTVDEHTIRAIGILNAIEQGDIADELPLATEIVHKVLSRRALYLALFLHDIAKGRGGDHSVLGEEVARRLCPRLGLTREETETVAWLVRAHLLMSATAFKRDLEDPKTVDDFVKVVQSIERLRLLVVLTACDIRAVGPNVWNGWKGTLLRELYHRAEEKLSGGHAVGERRANRVAAIKARLREKLADWDETDFERFAERLAPSYWLSHDIETTARHARLVREADAAGREVTIGVGADQFRDIAEITVYAPDHHGLFASVAGAMALSGASIADARVVTTGDGMALDTFWVQDADGGAFDDSDRIARMKDLVERTLRGQVRAQEELDRRAQRPSRTDVFEVEPRVLIDNRASNAHTLIEVNGRDRPGFLYSVTQAITKLGLSIASAHITTFGERAVDTFYVKDVFGLKITHAGKLEKIRRTLEEAIAEPDRAPGEGKSAAAE